MGKKALLMAIIVASVVIPLWAAREPSFARGTRRTVLHFAVFVAVWAYSVHHFYSVLKE